MALAIKQDLGAGWGPRRIVWSEWHIGEPAPLNLGRVVVMQADGDELNLILDAMAASRGSKSNQPKKTRFRIIYAEIVGENGLTREFDTGIVRNTRAEAEGWIAYENEKRSVDSKGKPSKPESGWHIREEEIAA